MKLAIIVPYRDRRDELDIFLPHIHKFLENKQIDYEIFIIEQSDDKPFNYGKLCNVGVNLTHHFADYYCFHDVDLLPINDDADYSYTENPTQLVFEDENKNSLISYDEYFGGVVIITKNDFLKINGYNNDYWGKGYVDLDLLYRCKKHNLPLVKKYNYKNYDNLNLDLKDRSIYKDVSHIVLDKNSIIISKNSNVLSKNYTISFHYKENFNKNNKKKIGIFRTYGKDVLQLFTIDKSMIFQFIHEGQFFQFVITDLNFNELNHYTITHNFKNKEFTAYVNGKKELNVNYDLTYDYQNKDVTIGDVDNEQELELLDFKLFTKILSKNEIKRNFYYGLKSNCMEFNKIYFYKDMSNLIDYTFNIWELLINLDKGNINDNKIKIIESCKIKLNGERQLPNRIKGIYKSKNKINDDIQTSYDPDIIENKKTYYEDLLGGKINTDKYGYKSLKYIFLDDKDIEKNTKWIKVTL